VAVLRNKSRALYPQLAERFVIGDLFNPPGEMRGAFDVVLEHANMSGLHPSQPRDAGCKLEELKAPKRTAQGNRSATSASGWCKQATTRTPQGSQTKP
jgi:hypothetical protein